MKIKTYDEFWLYYVSEHMNPSTRLWHALGTGCVILLLLFTLYIRNWWLLLLLPVIGYGPAWISHFMIEKNKPATFKYPLWSLRADFRMFALTISGRIDEQVELADQWMLKKDEKA